MVKTYSKSTMRESGLIKIIGHDKFRKLCGTKVLLVGAGGIGCELLKNLVLMGFGEIHVVDLDTIDLSNLNRQFLFRKKDVKKPKSSTAVEFVHYFSNSKLVPYQGNIMDTEEFPLRWFEQFSIIFNALDNLSSRRHVNKMAQFINKPLLESGTSGFDGYIHPIIPGKSECFDCTKKDVPKTFPVCTIRSTPSQSIHCVVWAKDFLFSQLFAGECIENNSQIDAETSDPEENTRLKQEMDELSLLQSWIKSGDKTKIKNIIEKLFIEDIENLLNIESLWKIRPKPCPIQNFKMTDNFSNDINVVWSLQENLNNFSEAIKKLMDRLKIESSIEFDKDDNDSLMFVTTASNIRSHIFHISMKSQFDVKQMAGNIIPAIATTNSIVAGLSSLVSLRVLDLITCISNEPTSLPMAFTSKASNVSSSRYLSNSLLALPNPNCSVCSHCQRGKLTINPLNLDSITLSRLISSLKSTYSFSDGLSIIDVSTQRLLSDYDFDDLLPRSLKSLNLSTGTTLLISDEESTDGLIRKPIELYLDISPSPVDFELTILPLVKYKDVDKLEMPEQTQILSDLVVNENGEIILDDLDPYDLLNKRPLKEIEEPITIKKVRLDDEIIFLD